MARKSLANEKGHLFQLHWQDDVTVYGKTLGLSLERLVTKARS